VTAALGGSFVVVAGLAAFVIIILKVGFGFVKSSDVYKESLAAARANPEVISTLGEPIEEGFMFTGSIQVNGGSGDADIYIPISGPKDSAKLHVVATKRSGQWEFNRLTARIQSTGNLIDLLGLDGLERTGPPI
jgi:hypothetical protein